ncbi:tetratricopeptide repeat protein [Janthinobacterium fluminis]|uniref:Tetratricopeptide repeat protein n=1 Tax=Janthinobacterium fluminis TaxID=2987524 RepID=A0ABT5K7Z3_9BURK|nr:tetratricopeptide repeat protein [Janthinobacterium fluminis]MDC8760770.1 tetratricopeptide repeat protein [Janthinobacterium fluminis]
MELHRLFLPPLTAPGEVVTFYSYKGGTGRTMALSNIAVLLARRQNATVPVLMIDWDMEAPGLHHYFGQHDEGPGVLEFFEACRAQLERFGLEAPAAPDAGGDTALALRVLDAIDWQQYVVRVDQGSPLYLMRAGRFDASYSDRLAQMHWDRLFHACPALFRCFADSLARHFRYVLVDSRTGRTDSAGICTTLLPKKLVVVFTPNRQSLEGVEALVTRAIEYRRSHEDEQRPLLVYPLPSRIEMGDGEQRAQWRRGDPHKAIAGFQPMFERLLRLSYGLPQLSLDSYFDEVQLQQTKTFAYGEQLAVRIDQGGDRFSLTRTFEAFLFWMTGGYFPWQSSKEIHLLAAVEEARHALDDVLGRPVALPLARDLARLGELYSKEGRHPQALECFRDSLAMRARLLGEDHADTLDSKAGMARVLRQSGKLDEARFLEEAVVEARAAKLGAEHPATLAGMANLAATLAQQGDCAAALELQDSVLAAYMRLLGREHLLTLGALDSRAATLAQMGGLEQARTLLETVVAARARLLGAEHPDTLASELALAQVLARQNELAGARRLFDAVARAQQRRFGADHAQTLATLDRLGEVLTRQGDWPAVRALHETLVAARERTRGPEHPETQMSQRNLAQALARYGEADALGADWRQERQHAARQLEDALLSASERLLDAHQQSLAAPFGERAAEGESLGAHGLHDTLLLGSGDEGAAPPTLAGMINQVQALLDSAQLHQARDLADRLREPLFKPGVASKLRKRGMTVLKRTYRLQGDKDALVALQEDEVTALEGALEARVGNR